jgi:hypothetical protein
MKTDSSGSSPPRESDHWPELLPPESRPSNSEFSHTHLERSFFPSLGKVRDLFPTIFLPSQKRKKIVRNRIYQKLSTYQHIPKIWLCQEKKVKDIHNKYTKIEKSRLSRDLFLLKVVSFLDEVGKVYGIRHHFLFEEVPLGDVLVQHSLLVLVRVLS